MIQSPEQLMKSKKGQCWEQAELARYLFNQKGIPCRVFFMDVAINARGDTQTHTFLTFESDGAFYWFEHSWEQLRGIHRYNSMKELLNDVTLKISSLEKNQGRPGEVFRIREYDAPKLPIYCMEYFYHCLNGREIEIDATILITSRLPKPAVSRRGSR